MPLATWFEHSNDTIAVRLRTNTEDLLGISGRHDEILRNAINLLREAYEKNLEPLDY